MSENNLVLKSIHELLGEKFYIPAYQRGYRWSKDQVTALLNDIWDFSVHPPKYEEGKEKPFYCLQPIVVKPKVINNSNDVVKCWEIVDGQQRLTTIFLILENLKSQIEKDEKNLGGLIYETRPSVEAFLKEMNQPDSEKNIDYFHIWQANEAIQDWFKNIANNTEHSAPRAKLAPTFLTHTKVLWYEVNSPQENSINIFTRLNVGKIPLTNSELIKALLLKKSNFEGSEAVLKQLQIASEWDAIEKSLQDDAFWFFIYNPERSSKYENRIEYIFDLKYGVKKDSCLPFETFLKFNEEYSRICNEKKDGQTFINDTLWRDVKNSFLCFEGWYKNRELYHLIGFLIDCGQAVDKLMEEARGSSKTEFKKYLEDEIKDKVAGPIDELAYPDPKIKRVLLLFNIQAILACSNSDMRFPFYKYKAENWDIEHVRSQTDKRINSHAERKAWAEDILNYFTGMNYQQDHDAKNPDMAEPASKKTTDEIELCEKLKAFIESDKTDDSLFNSIYKNLTSYFGEDTDTEDIDSISNLALLDAATNRSYRNAMFPIKRKTIIENDKNGIFIPICTKNVFLKYYSKKFRNVMHWQNSDAAFYREEIVRSLAKYGVKGALQGGENE